MTSDIVLSIEVPVFAMYLNNIRKRGFYNLSTKQREKYQSLESIDHALANTSVTFVSEGRIIDLLL